MENNLEANIPLLVPDVTFEDVYGSEKEKSELQKFILYSVKLSFDRRDLFPLGHFRDVKILLCGPKGTDMFHLAMAAAKEICAKFIPVNCREHSGEIENYVFLGGSDENRGRALIKAIFSKAEKNVPYVIFLNNIDAIKDAQSDNDYSTEEYEKHHYLRQPLLNELNVCREKRRDGVIVIAATNRFDLLDVYIFGKFLKRIET
jgi:cell division protease FtsH